MSHEQLIEHLRSTWNSLKVDTPYSDDGSSGDDNALNYLYLAPFVERMSIHSIEKIKGVGWAAPVGLSYTQQLEADILAFRPYFEDALTRNGITSIVPYSSAWIYDRISHIQKGELIKTIEEIQQKRGILNALLQLRNWAFFPEKSKRLPNHSRAAASYLNLVLNHLQSSFHKDQQINQFLKWCGKRTRKIIPWGFKEKELLLPPNSVLPIHQNEAASYIRYFLIRACDRKGVFNQHAEMVVFLSLCLACARQRANYFDSADILRVTKEDIRYSPLMTRRDRLDSPADIKEDPKASSAHKQLLLKVPTDFLHDDDLWKKNASQKQEESHKSQDFYKSIRINCTDVLISQSLAHGIELLGKFSITYKNVESRLSEAHEIIGLSQSSGGISPKCFFSYPPHCWQSVDTRKD